MFIEVGENCTVLYSFVCVGGFLIGSHCHAQVKLADVAAKRKKELCKVLSGDKATMISCGL